MIQISICYIAKTEKKHHSDNKIIRLTLAQNLNARFHKR